MPRCVLKQTSIIHGKMTSFPTVVLSTKGESKRANITMNQDGDCTMESIQRYMKKKEEPEMVGHYEQDSKILFLFGYKKGKKGTENKTELPEPHSELVLYGDILVLASLNRSWENPIPYTTDQWNAFAQGEEEEEEEEENDALSEEGSVKDAFEEEDEDIVEPVLDKEEEVEEEIPVVVKRRRAPIAVKIDHHSLKEEIPIDAPPESNPIRIKCLNGLTFLEEHFPSDIVRSLEKGIYDATFQSAQKQYIARNWNVPAFSELYRQIVRSVISNMHPISPVNNPRLLSRVKEGELTLYEVPFLSSYEMFPERWFALKDKLLQREQKILEGNKSRATDQFKCRRCQKRECTYYELQTRSADEPMTIFITCLNCGKEWRQGG